MMTITLGPNRIGHNFGVPQLTRNERSNCGKEFAAAPEKMIELQDVSKFKESDIEGDSGSGPASAPEKRDGLYAALTNWLADAGVSIHAALIAPLLICLKNYASENTGGMNASQVLIDTNWEISANAGNMNCEPENYPSVFLDFLNAYSALPSSPEINNARYHLQLHN